LVVGIFLLFKDPFILGYMVNQNKIHFSYFVYFTSSEKNWGGRFDVGGGG